MITIEQYADAVDLATAAHSGQRTKVGDPYILHPIRVSLALRAADFDLAHQAAGVLHDVVEDCAVPLGDVATICGHDVADAVAAVSRRPEESDDYAAFVTRAAQDPIGRWVKYFDIIDNLGRIDELAPFPEFQKQLRCRYRKALEFLEQLGVAA